MFRLEGGASIRDVLAPNIRDTISETVRRVVAKVSSLFAGIGDQDNIADPVTAR